MRATLIILLATSGLWGDFTRIYRLNTAIEETSEAYYNEQYDLVVEKISMLTDSMGIIDDGLFLNRAHTYYKKNGFSGDSGVNFSNQADSLFLKRVEATFYQYTKLWESDPVIASKSYNQNGLVTFKSRVVNNKIAQEEELIQSAMDYFKVALRKDPFNEKARLNYETLKKYKEFPNLVMDEVRALVKNRRYVEAFLYLQPFIEKDKRFTQHAEYAKRLGDIVKIETQEDES